MDPSGHYSDFLDFSGFDVSQSLPPSTLPAHGHHPAPPLQPHSAQPAPAPLVQHEGGMFDTTGAVDGEHFIWPNNGGDGGGGGVAMPYPDVASFLFALTSNRSSTSSPTMSPAARIQRPHPQQLDQQLAPYPPRSASPHDPSSPASILQQQLQQQQLQMQMEQQQQRQHWQQQQQQHQSAAQRQQLFRPASGPRGTSGDVGTNQTLLGGHLAPPAALYQQSLQHRALRNHHAGGGLTPGSGAGVAPAWNTPSPASSTTASHTPADTAPPPPTTTATRVATSSKKDYRPPKKQARLVQPPPPPPPQLAAQPFIRPAVRYPTSSTPVELITDAPPPAPTTSKLETRFSPTKRKQAQFSPTSPGSASRPRLRRTPSDPLLGSNKARSDRDKLSALFTLLDEQAWSVEDMLAALSDVPSEEITQDDVESSDHRKRIMHFVHRRTSIGKTAEQILGPEEIYRRWIAAREGEEGEDKILGLDGLYRSTGAEQHGSIIRNILTKDSVPYEEAQADIKMVDAALSRAPSPHTLTAHRRQLLPPTSASSYVGRLIIPSDQADILGAWLMSPGRPALANERDSITPDHMRIYSSLSPLELHARGAELCRVILTRDAILKARYGYLGDNLESFVQGPSIVLAQRCGFHEYDDYSLWHHALMSYLQICTRYPSFRDSEPATIDIISDQSLLPPTLLEISLIERALQVHWENFRQYLLGEGGLLRRAVKAFSGVKTRPMDLMLICDDANVVMQALKKSQKEAGAGGQLFLTSGVDDSVWKAEDSVGYPLAIVERILPYDPRVSEARNEWRQSAYWSENSHIMMWSAMTSHFLEISALYPRFSEGVRDLPGLEGLLNGVGLDKSTNGRNGEGSK